MKETQIFQKDELKIEVPAQHQKKLQLLSRKPIKKNQTLFEFDFKENTIKKVDYIDGDIIHFDKTKPKKKVVIKPNCVYIPALNFKNAIRHIHNKIAPNINPKIIE